MADNDNIPKNYAEAFACLTDKGLNALVTQTIESDIPTPAVVALFNFAQQHDARFEQNEAFRNYMQRPEVVQTLVMYGGEYDDTMVDLIRNPNALG